MDKGILIFDEPVKESTDKPLIALSDILASLVDLDKESRIR